ncbi:hypothetical protein PM082_009679 [Marasmius tenuissimus]|nr:hypothetical protein PM082_009679 [Marasmius tenuissimus]
MVSPHFRLLSSIHGLILVRKSDISSSNALDSSRTPIACVPNELLLKVFKEYVVAGGRVQGLLQVCQHWNDLTTHDPRLWISISIDVDKVNPLMDNSALEGISVQLARSRDLPLHICFSDSVQSIEHINKSSRESSSRAIFAAIWRHRHRWSWAFLKLNLFQGAGRLFWGVNREIEHFPLLRTLSVKDIPTDYSPPIDESLGLVTISIFQNAPLLSSLRMPAIFYGTQESLPLVTSTFFPQLRYVSVKRCSQDSLFRWLEHTRGSLTSLKVKNIRRSSSIPPTPESLVLPNLRSLRIVLSPGDYAFISRIVVPKLKTLVLHLKLDKGRADNAPGIPDLIARSGYRLKRTEICVPETVPLSDIRALFPDLRLEETVFKERTIVKKIYLIGDDSGRR